MPLPDVHILENANGNDNFLQPNPAQSFPETYTQNFDLPGGESQGAPSIFSGLVQNNPKDNRVYANTPTYYQPIDIDKKYATFHLGQDNEEIAYQNQTKWDRLGNVSMNLVNKTGSYLTQAAGFIGGAPLALGGGAINLANEAFGGEGKVVSNGNAISLMSDNFVDKFADNWKDWVQNNYPIYKSEQYRNGNIWQKLGTSDWWLDDGFDRAALAISMLVPGMAETKGLSLFGAIAEEGGALRATGIASKGIQALADNPELYGKLGKWTGNQIAKVFATGVADVETSRLLAFKNMVNTAQKMELYSWNVVGQSGLNGREGQVAIRKELKEQRELGLNAFTDDQIEDKAALGAAAAFSATVPLSLAASLYELPQIFSSAKMSQSLLKKFFNKESATMIEGALEQTVKPTWLGVGKKMLLTGLEHGQNESAQVAIGRYLEESIAGKRVTKDGLTSVERDESNPFVGIFKDFRDNIDDPNGQNNIALGTIQGMLMAFGGHVVRSSEKLAKKIGQETYAAEDTRNKNFINSVNQQVARRRYWALPENFMEKDENGKIRFHEDGTPIIKQQMLADMGVSQADAAEAYDARQIATKMGDNATIDKLNFNSLSAISQNFFDDPSGMEYLTNVLRMEAKNQSENIGRIDDVKNGVIQTPEYQLQENLRIVNELKKTYDAIEQRHGGFTALDIDRSDTKEVAKGAEYMERVKIAQYFNAADQIYTTNRIQKNNIELAELGITEAIEDPQSPTEQKANDLINENKQLVDKLQDYRNQYKNLVDKQQIKGGFEQYKKSEEEALDLVDQIKKEKERNYKTATVKQVGPTGELVDKDVDMGKEYQLSDPLLKIDGKLYVSPRMGVISPEFGGIYKVVLPTGKVAYLSPEDFKKYKISDEEVGDPLIPAMMSKAIDNVLNRDEYKDIEKPKEAKLDYVNELGNTKLINDIEEEFNTIAKEVLERRKELERQDQILLKNKEDIDNEQNSIQGKSGNVGTDSNEADIQAYAKMLAELPWEDKKKSYEELFSSTTSESEDRADQSLTKDHVKRSRDFLHNAPFLPNRNKMRAVLVTPNSEAFFGLEGLAKLSYGDLDMSKATDIDEGFVASVFVMQEGGKNYFVDKNGNKLTEVGQQADLSQVVFQTMPTTSLKNNDGEPRYRNSQEAEAKAQQKWWTAKRTELFNAKQDTPVQYYSFDVSQGIPNEIKTEETDPATGKKKVVRERNSVSDVFFKSLSEDGVERLLREDGGLIQISDDGNISFKGKNYKYPKGRPVLKYGDNISFLQNARLTTAKANAVYEVLNQMAQRMLADGEAGKKIKLDPTYTTFLQNTLYWRKGEITANNQMKLEGTTLYLGKEIYPIGMIADAKDEIIAQLKETYHNINRNTLKDASAKFTEFYLDDKGELAEREWQNYQTYLLSSAMPDGSKRSIGETPLSTSLAAPTDQVPSTFKQKYAVLSGLEAPAEMIAEAKKAATPPPAPQAPQDANKIGEYDINNTTVNKYKLTGDRTIDFTATFDKDGLVVATVKDSPVVDDIANDKAKVQQIVTALETTGKFPAELFKKSGVEGVYANPTEIVKAYLESVIQAQLDKQKAEQAPKVEETPAPEATVEVNETKQVKDAKEIATYGETMGEAYDYINHTLTKKLNDTVTQKAKKIAEEKGIAVIDLTEDDYKSIPEYNEIKRLTRLLDTMFSPDSMNEKTSDVVKYWEEQSSKKKRQSTAPVSTDAKSDIERRRNKELATKRPNALALDENGNLIEAASGAKTSTDFSGAFSGGINQTYQQIFDALEKGTNIIAGLKSSEVDKLKPLYDKGLIKSKVDVYHRLNEAAINAKYDEELAALEGKPIETSTAIEKRINDTIAKVFGSESLFNFDTNQPGKVINDEFIPDNLGSQLFNAINKTLKGEVVKTDKAEAERLFKEYAKIVHPDKNQGDQANIIAEAFFKAMSTAKEQGRVDILNELKKKFDEELAALQGKPAESAKFDASKTSNKSGKKYRLSLGEKGDVITDAEIQAFKEWHAKNVPFIPYEILDHMIEAFGNREAFGVFVDGVAKFYKKGLRGTEYHEVFHGIFRGFLNKDEQRALLDEFKSKDGTFTDRLTGKKIEYSQATDDQAEDGIADMHAEYRKGKLPARSIGERIARFFKSIMDFFKTFVSNRSKINELFDSIDSGKFKTAKPSAESISEIPVYRLKEGLTEQQIGYFVKDMVVRATSMVLGNQETKKLLFEPNKISGEEIFNRIKEDYIEDNKLGPNPDQLSEKAFEMLVKRTKEFLRTAPFNINMNDEDVASFNADDANKIDYAPPALTIDVKKSAPQGIRLAVGTLPEAVPTNQENSSTMEVPDLKENGHVKGLSLMNYARAMATLLDKLTNTNKVSNVVDKLVDLAKSNANYVRFFKRVGGDITTENPTIDFDKFEPEDWRLFVQMMQTFTVQRPDVKIEYTSGTEVYTGAANLNTVVNQTKDSWIENIKAKARAGESVLTYIKEKKEYKLSSQKELEKMPIATAQDQIKFLGNLGINFTFEDYSNLKTEKQPGETKSQVEQFADAVSSIRAYIGKGNSIIGVTAEVLGINGPMTTLAELYKKATDPNQETSYQGVDGQLRQSYTLNNAASQLENDFNEVKTLDELLQLRPQLADIFSTSAQILKKGGIFFTAKGERTDVGLKVGVIAGRKSVDTDKGTATTSLNKGERIVTELNRNLAGEYYILIAGDSATEWTMMLGNQISYADFEGGRAWNKVNKIFRGYLSDDVALALDYENRQTLANVGDKGKDLRFFKDILPEEMNTKITEMIDQGMTKQQIEDYIDKNIEKVNEAIKSYLTAQAVETRRILTQRGQIEEIPIKKNLTKDLTPEQIDNLRRFKFLGLEDKFTDRTDVNIDKKKMTLDEVNNLLLFARTNYNISNIEFHKILFGDPYEFAIKEKNGKIILDETKRIKSFESGRQTTFDSPEFNTSHNRDYNKTGVPGTEGRIQLSPNDFGYHTFKPYANTVTTSDINIVGTLLGKTNEADAFSWLIDGAYREIKLKNGKWNNATDEMWHQWQMAFTRNKLAAKGDYKYTNEALKKHDAELIQKPEPKNFIEVLKPIVTGSKYNKSYIDNILDKTSQMPLYYKATLMDGKETNLSRLYVKMFKENKDYLIVESGRKVGAENTFDLYKDGQLNTEPFNNNIQVPWNTYGIQVENTYDDMGGLVRMGSQGTKMVTMNLYDNGVPTSKRADEATKRNFSLLKELYKIGYQDVLKKMGVVDLGNRTYQIVDKKRLSKSLEHEMLRREMSQNAKDVIQTDEAGEFRVPFEATGSYIQIRNIIFSMIDKAITSRKTSGGSYVQTPVTLWEDASKGRRVVEINGKKVLTDDTLKFYDAENPYCEIMLPHWFKEKLDKKKFPNDEAILKYLNGTKEGRKILEGIAFRIPTQALSSMERIVVKGFLPPFMGKTVVVPSEITTKAGSDFDIDKLNIYLKSVYLDKNGDIRLVESKGSEEATKEFYGNVYDENIQSKIDRIERFDEFRDQLYDLFKKIESFGDVTTDQIEERLSKEEREFYDFHNDIISEIDNQAFEKDMETSDYIDSQIEELGTTKEKLNSKLFNEILRNEYIDKMYRKAIENDYYDSMSELLALPENYKHLISPVGDAGLSKLADKMDQLKGVNESAIKNRILDANYMSELRHNFITAKDWIGIVAVNITGQSITQKSRIYIDPARFGKLGYVDKKFLGDGSIVLNHNTIFINGEQYTSISGTMTADGKEYISDRLSGYGTAVVDVVKDPFILKLIQSDLSIGTTMFLERIGAGEAGLMFMQQPIIVEYLTMLDNKNVNSLFLSKNIKAIKNKFAATAKQIAEAQINVNGFENNIEQYRKGFNAEQNAEQQKILDEFLKYSKMAQYSFKLTQASNYDTTKFGSGDTLFLKNTREEMARETNIFSSVDDMLDNTHLGTQAEYLDALTTATAEFLILEKPAIRNITNNVLRRYAEQEYLSKDKFEKIANKVKASFLDYALQIKTGLGNRIYELLIDPKTSVASRIAEAKEKYPHLQILKELDVTSTPRVDGAKSLKLKANSRDGYTEDVYADMMRELRDENEETKALYNDIVNVALLQGTYRSAISIRNIIPNEDLSEKLKDTMTTLITDADIEAFANGAFEKNNFRDPDIWKEIVPNFVPAVALPAPTGDKILDQELREEAYASAEPIGFDEYDEDVYQYVALEYFPTINQLNISTVDRKVLLLDKQENFIESQAEFVKFPKVIKKDGMNINVVSGTTVSDALMRKTYATGDKTLNDVFGYQKVRYPDGSELTYVDDNNNRFSVYRMVNLLGDGQYATEHYADNRKSVIENGTVKIENEVSPADLISYFRTKMGIDSDVSKETVDETLKMLEAKAATEAPPANNDATAVPEYTVDKTLKNADGSIRYASTDGNVIKINPVTDANKFFNYFEGKEEGPTSAQKGKVIEELAKQGYSMDVIKSMLNTNKLINTFLVLHEQSHIDNNDKDVYWQNTKDLLTPDKIAIEVRATIDALEKMKGDYKQASEYTEEEKNIMEEVKKQETPLEKPTQLSLFDESGKDTFTC